MDFGEGLSAGSDVDDVRQVFLSQLPLGHEYRDRLDYHFDVIFGVYSHLARYSYSVNNSRQHRWLANYFVGEQKKEVKESGLLAGLWGINTRIFDDLMDGDGCEAPEDKEEFARKYISCFEDRNPEPGSEVEGLAFWAASLLVESFDDETREVFVEGLKDIMDISGNSVKSTQEGYRSYIQAAGNLGELTVECIRPVEGAPLKEGVVRIGYEVGLATQVADDIEDGDVELSDGEMLEVMSSERESFETFTGKLYAFLFSDGYGTISRIMYVLSDADSSKYDVL